MWYLGRRSAAIANGLSRPRKSVTPRVFCHDRSSMPPHLCVCVCVCVCVKPLHTRKLEPALRRPCLSFLRWSRKALPSTSRPCSAPPLPSPCIPPTAVNNNNATCTALIPHRPFPLFLSPSPFLPLPFSPFLPFSQVLPGIHLRPLHRAVLPRPGVVPRALPLPRGRCTRRVLSPPSICVLASPCSPRSRSSALRTAPFRPRASTCRTSARSAPTPATTASLYVLAPSPPRLLHNSSVSAVIFFRPIFFSCFPPPLSSPPRFLAHRWSPTLHASRPLVPHLPNSASTT